MTLRTLAIFFLLPFSAAFAQDAEMFAPDSIKKEISAKRIGSTLKINGVLNEHEWNSVPPSSPFIQIEPYQGERASHATDVRVLFNDHYLYVGIFSRDSLGRKAIRATDFKRDFNHQQHDLVTLSFDGFNDTRNAMALATNAYGVQRDLLSFDDVLYDTDWDGLWRVRTSRTDSGWVAEIAVPWQTLRYPKTSDSTQNWGFNIYRNRRLTNEITAFSPFPRSVSSLRMSYAGLLKGLQPPPPGTNIRIQPYLLASYDSYENFNPSIEPELNFKTGGELKWAINSNAVLDLTANTDFAQADADRQVNNVTRFGVFFPERRQFFLENASLFGVGIAPQVDGAGGNMRVQPFFSRRIGLDDNGKPVPIDAGGRFVYRSLKRNFGAIAMRQRDTNESPGTNFFVGRFSENFGDQDRVGALVAVKNRPDSTSITSTIDGFFRLTDSHSLNVMAIHSTSTGKTGKDGFSGVVQYQYSTNQMKIWWTESLVTRDFNPDMGFVSRLDVVGTTPGMNWYYRGSKLPLKKYIRAFEPGFLPEFYHQASTGKLIERQLPVFPIWINFQNGGWFGYSVNPTYQFLIEPFMPLDVNILPGAYNYTRQQIWFSTDPSKILNLSTQSEWGTYFNGKLLTLDFKLQFAPIPHISIIGRYNGNRFNKVGEELTTTTVNYYSVEGRFALNPRVQLIGFYQQNSLNMEQNYNIRLSLEYKPLSYIFFVYNHRGFDEFDSESAQIYRRIEDHVIAKISYLKQF